MKFYDLLDVFATTANANVRTKKKEMKYSAR